MKPIKDGATKRPWVIEGNFIHDKEIKTSIAEIYDELNYAPIGRYTIPNVKTGKANSLLIVKAVNRDHLFEELVEALKESLKYIQIRINNENDYRIKNIIEQVIAKVEGGE